MSTPNDDFDPTSSANFLQRYREARESITSNRSSSSVPSSPSTPRKSPPRNARSVWTSVFHPLGRSPTGADRYDLSRGQVSNPGSGQATSEVHARGTGISLDAIHDDDM